LAEGAAWARAATRDQGPWGWSDKEEKERRKKEDLRWEMMPAVRPECELTTVAPGPSEGIRKLRFECSTSEVGGADRGYGSDPEVIDVYIPVAEFEEHREMECDESAYTLPRRSRALPLEEVGGRIGQGVYEVFQVKPRRSMQRDILVKNDGGSQLTFVDPALFAYGLKLKARLRYGLRDWPS
jgi:hypothetical protein